MPFWLSTVVQSSEVPCCDVPQYETDSSPAPRCGQAGRSSNNPASKFIPHYINHAAVCGWIPDKLSQLIRSSTICTAAEDPLTGLEHSQYVVKLNAPQRVSSRRALGASRPKCTEFPLHSYCTSNRLTHFLHYIQFHRAKCATLRFAYEPRASWVEPLWGGERSPDWSENIFNVYHFKRRKKQNSFVVIIIYTKIKTLSNQKIAQLKKVKNKQTNKKSVQ